MDAGILTEAIRDQLDGLETVFNVAVGLAFAAGWAGLTEAKSVTVLSMTISRRRAFWLIVGVFLFLDLAAALYFWRLGTLIALLPEAGWSAALATLAAHGWVLNPFAYHGAGAWAPWIDGLGATALALIWWLCVASLFVVRPLRQRSDGWTWAFLLTIIGVLTMAAAWQCVRVIPVIDCGQLAECTFPARADYALALHQRWPFVGAGVILGIACLVVVVRRTIQARGDLESPS